jgi:hypothetical protein
MQRGGILTHQNIEDRLSAKNVYPRSSVVNLRLRSQVKE